MPCLNPKKLWQRRDGSGVMTMREELGRYGTLMLSPCGNCFMCRASARMDWATRLYHESVMHEQSSFGTGTYSDEFYDEGSDWTDIREFRKVVRDRYGIEQAYVVEEWGETTQRRHWHWLFFGRDFAGLDESYPDRDGHRCNPELESLWGKGKVVTCALTPDTCNYVAGYVQKKSPSLEEAQQNPYEPKGRSMSKRAIGRAFCEAYLDDMVRSGFCVVGESKRPIPSVYFDWYPDELAHWKEMRLEKALEQAKPENRKAVRVGTKNKALNMKARMGLQGRSL